MLCVCECVYVCVCVCQEGSQCFFLFCNVVIFILFILKIISLRKRKVVILPSSSLRPDFFIC